MNLTQVPNLRTEDFSSENQGMLSRLFIMLNPFIQSVNQVITNNIDYTTNIKAVTKSYSITAFQAFSISWPFTGATPNDVRVIQATKGADLTPTILLAPWSYNSSTKLITISSMVEISGTTIAALSGTYNFTIRATI